MNFKADIQRIIDYKNNIDQRLFSTVIACDSIKSDGKAINLLDECGKKCNEYEEFFKNLIIESGISVDSNDYEIHAFWLKVENKYRELDTWLTNFNSENGFNK